MVRNRFGSDHSSHFDSEAMNEFWTAALSRFKDLLEVVERNDAAVVIIAGRKSARLAVNDNALERDGLDNARNDAGVRTE
jgi:hypothetical protein